MLVMAKRKLVNRVAQTLFEQGFVYDAERDGERVIIHNELSGESVVRWRDIDKDFEVIEDLDIPVPTIA